MEFTVHADYKNLHSTETLPIFEDELDQRNTDLADKFLLNSSFEEDEYLETEYDESELEEINFDESW